MNTPFLDSNGNPMEFGYFYSITVNHVTYPEIQYLSRKTNTQMMRFKIFSDLHRDGYKLLIGYDPNNRPKRLNRTKKNITDNEDNSENDFGDDDPDFVPDNYLGGKSKKNTIKRRKRVSNKRRKSNKKKKRRSIKRRK
jgi:hypothetical protein